MSSEDIPLISDASNYKKKYLIEIEFCNMDNKTTTPVIK